jgi:lipopolysaccharide transport protein LptA
MKSKKTLKLFIIIFLIGILIYVFAGLKRKESSGYIIDLKSDGEKMVHSIYDKKNRRAMEVKCSEALKESDDKLVMKGIEGVIFKKGRMNKDIQVHAKKGHVANNNKNFYMENDARIISEEFSISSRNFLLKDQSLMNTGEKVHYNTEDLKGIAKKGMEYYLKLNVLKFFKTRGHYKRDDRDFSFKTDVLWVIDKDKLMVMENKAVIREQNSILRSGWLSIKFTDKFDRIKEAASQKNSYLYIEDREKKEIKEIKSDNITSFYNKSGKLTKITVMQNAEILLKSEANHTMIASDLIEMHFDAASGKIKKISIPSPGLIENKGKTDFRITANTINANYNKDGELSDCQGTGNTEFIIDEYKGKAETLSYNIEKNSITQKGQDAQIINRNNTFNSTNFFVNTEKKKLSSGAKVKSIIRLAKINVLLSEAPIFINADNFSIFQKKNTFSYKKRVNLVQDDIGLRANSLEIIDENDIEASGKVSLSFKSDEKEVAIRGERITFNAKEKNIEIRSNAVIKNDENILKANRFVVQFNDKNEITGIYGEDGIDFEKDDLYGTSGKVEWLFKEDTMILKDLPQIAKRNGGITIGEELKIDLKTDKITILSSDTERTETIIE